MKRIDCEIIKDLLPLYCDKAVSEKTAEAVREHLKGCDACKAEYEKLGETIPEIEESTDTAVQFRRLMKKQKAKRIAALFLTAVTACAVFFAGYKFLTEATVIDVPQYEFDFIRVFRYETEQGKKFFIMYKAPDYWASTVTRTLSNAGGENGEPYRLEISMKKTILGEYTLGNMGERLWIIDAEDFYGNDYEELWFKDRTIWSEAANGYDTVPEYVYMYDEFRKTHAQGYYWEINYDKGYVGAGVAEEKTFWSFDGEEIAPPDDLIY